MSFQEAKRRSPAIAEFSGLGEYLNLPTRTYSSGMFLRLAFAISTSVEPEILIMDEMISAGDSQFIEKAERRLREIVDKANILALASHDMKVIQRVCNKVVWLEHGTIKQFGPPERVVRAYESVHGNAGVERTGVDEAGLLPNQRAFLMPDAESHQRCGRNFVFKVANAPGRGTVSNCAQEFFLSHSSTGLVDKRMSCVSANN